MYERRTILVIELSGNWSVNGRERVIQEIEVSLMVDSSGQVDSCLLTSTESHSSLSYQCQISMY